ncbi:MAG: alpha/beta hydrolase [Chloroflexi bacterium]|nr:alpha/beta hydrolase [Chloroflexota bacterium]
MTIWESYTAGLERHTVVGELLVQRAFYSPQLDNRRDVLVWLPASYHNSARRYPVLYMHDGQNLFDAHTSFVGEWQVDETLSALQTEGYEAIVVGLPNLNEERVREYNPYPSAEIELLDGRGDAYLRFIVDTLKPQIDAHFRTQPEHASTGIAGSSMGGLISLYGFLTHPQVFGFCGVFSPAYWFGANGLEGTVQQRASGAGRIYMDVGGKEGHIFETSAPWRPYLPSGGDQAYLDGVRRLRAGLLARGYHEGTSLLYVEDADAIHQEGAWAKRLPDALRFILPKLP